MARNNTGKMGKRGCDYRNLLGSHDRYCGRTLRNMYGKDAAFYCSRIQ